MSASDEQQMRMVEAGCFRFTTMVKCGEQYENQTNTANRHEQRIGHSPCNDQLSAGDLRELGGNRAAKKGFAGLGGARCRRAVSG